MRRTLLVLAVGVLAVGVLAVGAFLFGACERDSSPPPTTSSSTSTTVDGADPAAEEREVIEAYLAELDAFYAAANPPDPDHPALEETMTGEELEAVRANLRRLAADGIAIRRGTFTHQPTVSAFSSRSAVVEECVVDDDVQFLLATGEVVNDEVSVGILTTTLVRSAHGWRVQSSEFRETPCAPS